MIYHNLAVNVPLFRLFTYSCDRLLPPGTRVGVRFRGKRISAVVWAADVAPESDPEKILPIEEVFDDETVLPDDWRALLDFTARYYHYPLGQAVTAALPQRLREPRSAGILPISQSYKLTDKGRLHPPSEHHRRQYALWTALSTAVQTDKQLKQIHPQAAHLIEQWLEEKKVCVQQEPSGPVSAVSGFELNEEQKAAAEAVKKEVEKFAPFLLYGITGSGKTEVYFDIMADTLARGRQVLFLLPEISLTPQLLSRLGRRFPGVSAALLHSGVAAGARCADFRKALAGEAKLIVGTRLAVFTPIPDLGLIVVDEEHDGSFKQESDMRYQARDLAVWRAGQSRCPVVLGSATPSLESWRHARNGSYRLLKLETRAYRDAVPPVIRLLDMKKEPAENGISLKVLQALRKNHENGGMSMVYVNRRGFAPALFCDSCGHTFGCPHCSAKMVLHKRDRCLRCHHCGNRAAVPSICPECGNQDLAAVGQGTQRVEEMLRAAIPGARILRVDKDSTSGRQDWSDLYATIHRQEADILVGTQMLAKGHDFARLDFVAVINADGSLFSADFRADEHLFAELMQVSGRAGRAEHPGEVWIQTSFPDHPVFQAVLAQNYPLFADAGLAERKMMELPPFSHMIAVRADARNAETAQAMLQGMLQAASESGGIPDSVRTFGPVPMRMVKLAGYERVQVFLEGENRRDVHRALSACIKALQYIHKKYPKTRWLADVDPLEL